MKTKEIHPGFLDYRQIMCKELECKKKLTPKYFLRDFAKDIGISPAHLSYVLRNQRGLSRETGTKVAVALGLKNLIRRTFVSLVALHSGRSKLTRNMGFLALRSKALNPLSYSELIALFPIPNNWSQQANTWFNREPLVEFHIVLRRLQARSLEAYGVR